MNSKHYIPEILKLVILVFAFVLPNMANGYTEDEISEKRIAVAMRMIGHEVLMCLGDYDSRVLPIEINENHYKIPFEQRFGIDPANIIAIIERVMTETEIGTFCLVEVEQCESGKIVHSFVIGSRPNSSMIACGGRILPEDCYSLIVTILDETETEEGMLAAGLVGTSNDANSAAGDLSSKGMFLSISNFKKSTFVFIPILFLIGFLGFYMKRKRTVEIDPNLIKIGSSQFDRRSMILQVEDNKVELSNKEAELLSLLHASANIPVEREVILQKVWGDDGDYIGRTLDVFISKLRKKLEADVSVKIVNIRSVGYKLVMDVPA